MLRKLYIKGAIIDQTPSDVVMYLQISNKPTFKL